MISFLSVRRGDRPDYLKFDRSTIRNDQPGGAFVHFLAPRTRGEEKEKEEHVSRETLIRAGHVAPPSIGVKPLNREGSSSIRHYGSSSHRVFGILRALSGQNCTITLFSTKFLGSNHRIMSRAERRPQSSGFAVMLRFAKIYPNLARALVLTGVDQFWVVDITYIRWRSSCSWR